MSDTYGNVTPKMRPILALDLAVNRTREFLFRPFNFARWISLGVIIFMESLVMGGGCSPSGNYGSGNDASQGIQNADDLREAVNEGVAFLQENIVLVMSIGAVVLLIMLAFTVLFAWLGSRGQLMFIRAVATGDHAIGNNWQETRALSTSLFQFRLILNLVGMFFSLTFTLIGLVMAVNLLADYEPTTLAFWIPLLVLLLIGLLGVATLLTISLLLRDFVAPFMFHFNVTCMAAWSMFGGLVWGNIWALHVFYFMRMVIGVVGGIVGFFAGCLTCCIGFMPVIRQTLLAPIYVFDRAYSLHVIASMGPEYQMIHALGPPPSPYDEPPPVPNDEISMDEYPPE